MIETYQFYGDSTTYLGAIALFGTPVLLWVIFRSFYHSPLNK